MTKYMTREELVEVGALALHEERCCPCDPQGCDPRTDIESERQAARVVLRAVAPLVWDAAIQVERLQAERDAVLLIAREYADQPTDYDEDTEAEIALGNLILEKMGEPLSRPHTRDV